MPPLAGPRSMECCTLNPVNTSSVPSSICTGTCTITSRLGSRSIFHRPSSSPSFFAAKSERRTCACQGLTSSRYAVVITPLCTALVVAFDPSGTTVYPSTFAPNNERQVVRDDLLSQMCPSLQEKQPLEHYLPRYPPHSILSCRSEYQPRCLLRGTSFVGVGNSRVAVSACCLLDS